ncbi:MAG: MBL fold metallo-hydrolase [Sedimentisphaerales bacterium]|nr:MBL fold metallo-hydrolase [Sedimentisphaerales bacterium]
MVKITVAQTCDNLADQLQKRPLSNDKVYFWWLGQAGFIFLYRGRSLMIDPYLSNHLAEKYAGKEFDHVRMMPAPIQPEQVQNLDWLLCTHAHGDHMDPQTLPLIMQNNPKCRIVVPAAETSRIREIGLDSDTVIPADEGDTINLAEGITVSAIASAHEQTRVNEAERHHFLGYVIRMGHFTVYHPGDCVPYASLAKKLRDKGIDLALMPVNGRDEYRAERNIPGNFTFEESLDLCRRLGIPLMMCHHFSMFSFNTIDPAVLRDIIDKLGAGETVLVPQLNRRYSLSKQ